MRIDKMLNVFDVCISNQGKLNEIKIILDNAMSDVNYEDYAAYYLDRIREVVERCNQI